jgi:hypothetical protein
VTTEQPEMPAAFRRLRADVRSLRAHLAEFGPDRIEQAARALATPDGLWWHEAPIPRRWHRCRAQSALHVGGVLVERCACGASNRSGTGWYDRNTRKREATP